MLFKRILLILIGFTFIVMGGPAYAGWVSPTGASDPGNQWISESNAYDDNTGTYASNQYGGTGWGQWIVLTLGSGIYCDMVRVNADYGYGIVDAVQIDVYDGTWHTVHNGAINDCAWTEISFSAYNNVTQVRFRFHYTAGGYYFWLYEFDFWEGQLVVEPTCDTDPATSVEETSAVLHGQVTDDGGELCEYRFQYGLTDSYGNNTSWTGSTQTNDTFGEDITGLSAGNTYHFRAQVRNSVGVGSGEDETFFTGAPSSGWVTPAGNSDPNGEWENESNAHDDELTSYARSYHDINDPDGQWSFYIHLTHPAIISDKIRLYARAADVDRVDIDVTDGVSGWTDVYEGSFSDKTWVEQSFSQQTVTEARIRFRAAANNEGFYWELYEFDFWRISSDIPTLSWTGETNYASDGLDPEIGCSSTPFEFRVEYTDAGNDAPSTIQLYLDKNGDTDYGDAGEVIDMSLASDAAASKRDGDYTNGEIFTVTTAIPYGPNTDNCSYYFAANDGIDDATGAPTSPTNAPDIVKGIGVFTGDDNPGNSNETSSATAVEMLQIKFETDGIEDVRVTDIELTPSGTGHDVTDLPSGAVQIYRDENDNGIYDPSVDTYIDSGNYSADNAATVFDIPDQVIAKNSVENWLIVYDFSSSVTDTGETFKVEIYPNDVNCEGEDSGDTFTGYGEDVIGGTKTIDNTTGSLGVSKGSSSPLDSNAANDAQDVEMLQVSLTASDIEDINISSIAFKAWGTIDDSSDITDAELWLDVDDDGILNSSIDSQIDGSKTYSTDNGTITFSGLSESISAGDTENWLVVYDLAGSAIDDDTAIVEFSSNSDITATGATSGSSITPTGAPIEGQTLTISEVGNLILEAGENSPSDSNEPDDAQNLEMLQLSLTASVTEDIDISSITFTASGTGDDSADITSAELFLDVNDNGIYNSGTDTQIDSSQNYSLDNGTITFSGLSESISAGDTENWLVVYDLAGSASEGDTFKVRFASSSDITATGHTSTENAIVTGDPAVGCLKTVSSTGSLTLSEGPGNPPDTNETADAQDVETLQLSLQASDIEDIAINSFQLIPSGTGNDSSDLPANSVQIAIDENQNGIYESGTDTLITSGNYSGDDTPTTFTINHTITQGSTEYWLIFYDFNSSVTDEGDTFSVKLHPTGISATGVSSASSIDCGGSTAEGGVKTIDSNGTGSLTLSEGPNNPADSHINNNDQDLEMVQLGLSASSVENIQISQITFTASGSGDDSSDISSVELYIDNDDDGELDGTDTQINGSQSYSSDNGTVTFSSLSEVVNAGDTENWLLIYDLAGSASTDETFRAQLSVSTQVSASGVTSGNPVTPSGAPVRGGVMTISTVPTLSWTGEAGYVADGVSPDSGYSDATFTFMVEYNDLGDDPPTFINVCVDKDRNGNHKDAGEVYAMSVVTSGDPTKRDGDYTNGEWYEATVTNIPYDPVNPNAAYLFEANDGTDDATGDPTSSTSGPQILQTLSVTVNPSNYDFTLVDAGTYTISSIGIDVTNDGDGDQDYKLEITVSPASWSVKEDAGDPAAEEYKLFGLFNSIQPADGDFTDTEDVILESAQKDCDTTNFAGDEDGDDVASTGVIHLWFRFGAPSATTEDQQQSMTVTIEAFSSGEF